MKRRASTLLALLALSGCSFESKGFSQLFDGSFTYVSLPGRQWLAGKVKSVRLDAGDPNVRMLAQREDGELLLAPFESEACSVGIVAKFTGFWPLSRYFSSDPPSRVPFLSAVDADGRGPLSFAASDCSVWSSGLEHAEVPMFALDGGYLVRDSSSGVDQLFAVDPWQRSVTLLADSVQGPQQDYLGRFFSVEGSDLVERKPDLSPRLVQNGVKEFLVTQAGRVAVTTDASFVVERPDATRITVSANHPCQLRSSDDPGMIPIGASVVLDCAKKPAPDTLMAFDARTDRLLRFSGLTFENDVSVVLDGETLNVFALTDTSPLPAPDHRRFGTLWGAPSGGLEIALQPIAERSVPPRRWTYPLSVNTPRFWGNIENGLGQLLDWHPETSQTTLIAQGVQAFDGTLAIVDSDGTRGNLLAAYAARPRELLGQVTSLSSFAWTSAGELLGVAFTSDEQDGNGRLFSTVQNTATWANPQKLGLEHVADNVASASIGWFSFGALAYIRDADASTHQGTLTIRFVDSKDTFERAGVSRWQGVDLGDGQGVLYVIPEGPEAGVWFAAAH